MKIVFIGCVEIGLRCLEQVLKDRWEVKAIFTLHEKYGSLTSGFCSFSPLASRHRIPLYKVRSINESASIKRIQRIRPDLIIVCGWQQLVGAEILKVPRLGTIGFHSSLLPKYRGRAPVNWAIIAGEKRTGVTLFYCEPDADTGDIIAQKSFPISLRDTCGTIYAKGARVMCQFVHEYLPKIEKGTVRRVKNRSRDYPCWPKRRPEDGQIDWNRSALETHNWIRALTRPYPGAFTYHAGEKYYIWGSQLNGAQRPMEKHPPGSILEVRRRRGRPALLVATLDQPLWVYDVTPEGEGVANDFSVGGRFSWQ